MRIFSALFRIALKHDFYVGKVAKDLVLEPTPSTAALLARYDLVWRKNDVEYVLFFGKESLKAPGLSLLTKTIGLRFILKSVNPYFLNITDIPFPKEGAEKFYLHNQRPGNADNQPTALSQGATVGPEDLHANDFGLRPNDLGVIDIFIGRGENLIPPPTGTEVTPEHRYHASFKSRPTRWRYYVINNNDVPPAGLKLFEGKTQLDAESEEPKSFPNLKQTAAVISTKASIPLFERPESRLRLEFDDSKNAKDSDKKPISIDLPTPDWRRLSAKGQDPVQQVFSDIFVYL